MVFKIHRNVSFLKSYKHILSNSNLLWYYHAIAFRKDVTYSKFAFSFAIWNKLVIQYAQALLFAKKIMLIFLHFFSIFWMYWLLFSFVVGSGCAIHWPMTKDLVTTWKEIQRFHFTRLPFLIRIYRRKISKLIYVTTHACLIGTKIYTKHFSGFEIWDKFVAYILPLVLITWIIFN